MHHFSTMKKNNDATNSSIVTMIKYRVSDHLNFRFIFCRVKNLFKTKLY